MLYDQNSETTDDVECPDEEKFDNWYKPMPKGHGVHRCCQDNIQIFENLNKSKNIVKYIRSDYNIRDTFLESFCVNDDPKYEHLLQGYPKVILKDKRPISFLKAMKLKNVKKELTMERERNHGFNTPFSGH